MQSPDNFTAKLAMIRCRLDRIKQRQSEHFRQFKRLKRVNMKCKVFINVLNTISVTSLVLTFAGTGPTLIICTCSNSLSAIGTAILSVINMEDKSHSHQTSYLQFVELHDTYTAELLVDNLCGQDLDRILSDLNSKVGLILDKCEPIELVKSSSPQSPQYSGIQAMDPLRSISAHQQPYNFAQNYPPVNIPYSPQYQQHKQLVFPSGPSLVAACIPPYNQDVGSPAMSNRTCLYPDTTTIRSPAMSNHTRPCPLETAIDSPMMTNHISLYPQHIPSELQSVPTLRTAKQPDTVETLIRQESDEHSDHVTVEIGDDGPKANSD
jgi:hypothetical protein